MDKLSALRQFSFYTEAPSSFQTHIESIATPVKLGEGKYFVREGDVCAQFAILVSGSLRVFKVGENGREITLYHVCAGQTCLANMLCTLVGTPSPATAITEGPVEALIMPAESFRRWVAEVDVMREFVFQTLANRFMGLMTLVEEITFRKLDRRLADYLHRRFFCEGIQLYEVTATHEAIATELGSVREVISRLLREFERVGAIQTARGRILLRDAEILSRIGGEPAEQ